MRRRYIVGAVGVVLLSCVGWVAAESTVVEPSTGFWGGLVDALVAGVQGSFDPILNILAQVMWGLLHLVLAMLCKVLDILVLVWPAGLSSGVLAAASFFSKANYWFPITEVLLLAYGWLSVVLSFFLVKVVLYLF